MSLEHLLKASWYPPPSPWGVHSPDPSSKVGQARCLPHQDTAFPTCVEAACPIENRLPLPEQTAAHFFGHGSCGLSSEGSFPLEQGEGRRQGVLGLWDSVCDEPFPLWAEGEMEA